MSNNPLEAVTQAVNSLVTALKLPDESPNDAAPGG